jgi:ferredoxin
MGEGGDEEGALCDYECVACGTCIEECPNEAIEEGEEKYSIISTKCDQCGPV